MDTSLLGWIFLASFDGFGSRTLFKLARHFSGKGERAMHAGADVLLELGVKNSTIDRLDRFRKKASAERFAEFLVANGIWFMLHDDDRYPPLLRHISDPPFALFGRGNEDLKDMTAVSIVGTRRSTAYGAHVTRWIGNELAHAGVTVVSGLAGGIDTIAHEAALEMNGRCIAVLGSGIDDDAIYPRTNLDLAKRILENGGTVLSEFPPGTEGLKFHFPLRNRIISGMSRATIVVEAAEKSGSLITAFQALEQNRDVFAVPGPITNAQSMGTNRLLRMGAEPCTSPDDILRSLNGSVAPPSPCRISLTVEEQDLLDLLDAPRHIDDLARALAIPVAAVNARLMRLELSGVAVPHGGGIYARTRR